MENRSDRKTSTKRERRGRRPPPGGTVSWCTGCARWRTCFRPGRSGERITDYDYQATWTRPSGLSSLTVGSTSSSFFSDNYLPLHDARIAGNTIGRYLLRLAVNMMKIWDSFIGPNKESYYWLSYKLLHCLTFSDDKYQHYFLNLILMVLSTQFRIKKIFKILNLQRFSFFID